MMRRTTASAALLATVLGMLAGCAGDDATSKSDAGSSEAVSGELEKGAAAQRGASETASSTDSTQANGAAGGIDVPSAAQAIQSRALVYTATLDIESKDVVTTARAIAEAAAVAGGLVYGQSDSYSEGATAQLTLKVGPDKLEELMASIAQLGKETGRTLSTDDVTGAVVDLDARIISAQKSLARTQEFLDRTNNVGELSAIEAELTRRETALEQLVGQRRAIGDQVALATLTVSVSQPVPAEPKRDERLFAAFRDTPSFSTALGAGIEALGIILKVLLTIVGFLAPFVAIIGLPLYIWRRIRARRWERPDSTERNDDELEAAIQAEEMAAPR